MRLCVICGHSAATRDRGEWQDITCNTCSTSYSITATAAAVKCVNPAGLAAWMRAQAVRVLITTAEMERDTFDVPAVSARSASATGAWT